MYYYASELRSSLTGCIHKLSPDGILIPSSTSVEIEVDVLHLREREREWENWEGEREKLVIDLNVIALMKTTKASLYFCVTSLRTPACNLWPQQYHIPFSTQSCFVILLSYYSRLHFSYWPYFLLDYRIPFIFYYVFHLNWGYKNKTFPFKMFLSLISEF